ncbi:unnamed protein product [Phytophthora fragariaefolia]|uniref:Unnamed protein product n=1 Tax=Phytophthora fragariaefolia TaxID=1490495 RepID=A0A9W7D169_9STRA|nr:unnamed protein product [Phytophthora fragariaefolia]
MEVCPTGDCTNGKFMRLTVKSLEELDSSGTLVDGKSVSDFNTNSNSWAALSTTQVDGVNISSTSFLADLVVGEAKVAFNLTASIADGNVTLSYGSQTLTVPAGALKFTVDITGWTFADATNTLALSVALDAKGPKGKALASRRNRPKTRALRALSTALTWATPCSWMPQQS